MVCFGLCSHKTCLWRFAFLACLLFGLSHSFAIPTPPPCFLPAPVGSTIPSGFFLFHWPFLSRKRSPCWWGLRALGPGCICLSRPWVGVGVSCDQLLLRQANPSWLPVCVHSLLSQVREEVCSVTWILSPHLSLSALACYLLCVFEVWGNPNTSCYLDPSLPRIL